MLELTLLPGSDAAARDELPGVPLVHLGAAGADRLAAIAAGDVQYSLVLDGKFIGTYRRDEAERGGWNTEDSSRRTTQSAEKSRSVRANRDKKILQLP